MSEGAVVLHNRETKLYLLIALSRFQCKPSDRQIDTEEREEL